jgi:hypothetical protein
VNLKCSLTVLGEPRNGINRYLKKISPAVKLFSYSLFIYIFFILRKKNTREPNECLQLVRALCKSHNRPKFKVKKLIKRKVIELKLLYGGLRARKCLLLSTPCL